MNKYINNWLICVNVNRSYWIFFVFMNGLKNFYILSKLKLLVKFLSLYFLIYNFRGVVIIGVIFIV